MIERNFRRAMLISDGSFSFIWERPLTLSILIVAIVVLLVPLLGFVKNRRAKTTATPD